MPGRSNGRSTGPITIAQPATPHPSLSTALRTTGSTDAAEGSSPLAASTKAVLVILFQSVAGPIGAYMLARAAHIDGAPMFDGTLSDDLAVDSAVPESRDGKN